ncbi:signal recognition particle-docking protein FtsY [Cyanobium sp. Morenito 9A2]|uniref:signal recognition particle-docking protein FtsY n=1 Tax=Cyanobium sp. Morenito 9A2 TaxID=2823718 RepID=UPI0020CE4FA5|nr:signal recognition particle-docking protein FtsY [Cyanobium sp. Morenito 9A2]MCP9850306.1 signal recognition particle-docking protein FtsY [Cyanobium sp. Morenito 9A2]
MVFNWFQRGRRVASEGDAGVPPPGPESPADPRPATDPPAAEPPSPGALAPAGGSTPDGEAGRDSSPTAPAPSPALSAPLPPPPPRGVSPDQARDEALEWAREAYARLKDKQEAERQAAAATATTVAAPPAPGRSAIEAAVPTPPERSSTDAGAPEPMAMGQGLSLLERAAAERRQRQEALLERAPGTPTAAAQAPASGSVPAPTLEDQPQLGAFDADFTWSAEVLAAQGRRVDQVSLEEIDWLSRLRRGMEKTRQGLVSQLLETFGDDPLGPEVLDELESLLLRADVGVKATDQVLEALRRRLNVEVVDPSEGIRFLKQQLQGLLEEPITASGQSLLAPARGRLNVWLLVGVNGVGKTTTLGKLAHLAVRSGYSCLIAAADTFRAAAVEQVKVWGERSGVAVIANASANADPAAVVFDAIGAAQSRGLDLVLVDTAGRLQTKHNLMEELAKVRRIVDRLAPEAAVESLLVLDSSQGQNGLRQAMAFAKAAGLTGVVLTKLDGSSRGGVAVAVASEAGLPIRFIGAGETIRDLRPFNSFEFVEALLAT